MACSVKAQGNPRRPPCAVVVPFMLRQHEHEIAGESAGVPPDCPVQRAGSYSVKYREVCIEHDPLGANEVDQPSQILWFGFRPFHSLSNVRR